jgi:L-gulonolactone oxidase
VARTFRNWSREVTAEPARYLEPRSTAEVRAALREAQAAGRRVRVVGAGHSWNDAVCTGETLISLDRMGRLLSVDRERMEARVQGGIRLHQLLEALASLGLTMVNVGSVSEQSLAGAIATGTHGTGIGFGNLATQVVRLTLVTPAGDVLDLSRDPSESAETQALFRAASIHLGALGVVTEMTVRVTGAHRLRETTRTVPFERFLEELPERVAACERVKYWWFPFTDRVKEFVYERTGDPPNRGRGLGHRLERSLPVTAVFNGIAALGRSRPSWVPSINRRVMRLLPDGQRVDRSDRLLVIAMPPRHSESEFSVEVKDAAAAMAALRERVCSDRLPVNLPIEVRFVAADDLLLSPNRGRASCHFTLCIHATRERRDAYFGAAASILLGFGGRPHWGKTFDVEPSDLQRAFPGLVEFRRIRAGLDPHQTLRNHYVERVLG